MMEYELTTSQAATAEKETLEIAKLRLEAEKLKVEINKLSRERRLAPLALAAQVFGSICIIVATGLVLYFFQWPQLQEMEAARISNERLQIESQVLTIQKYDNDNAKLEAFEVLASQWPKYGFLTDLARSAKALVEGKRVAADCNASAVQLGNLRTSIKELETRTTETINVGPIRIPNPNRPALEAQKQALQAQVATIQAERRQKNCPNL